MPTAAIGRRGRVRRTAGVPPDGVASAAARSPAVAKRSRGSRPSARVTAASTAGGTCPRSFARDGGGPMNRFAITDCGVSPVKGGSPLSIS